jgi:DNA polymerase III subunit epsilon
MIILSLDFETTGLDVLNDKPIEVGAVLYSTGQNRILETAGYLVKSDTAITKEVTSITGLTNAAVNKFGFESREALDNLTAMIELSDAIIGQNVIRFDKRVYQSWCQREQLELCNKLWIDTGTDLVDYRTDKIVDGKHLGYMAADAGFLNAFPHGAVTDCLTVLKLVEYYAPGENFRKIVERAESPTKVLIAQVSFADNQLAKDRKFRWNPEYKKWWKTVKDLDMDEEVSQAKFNISIAGPEILIEKLWYD